MNKQISRRTALTSASLLFIAGASAACAARQKPSGAFANAPERGFTDQQWQAKLSPSAYAVLRHEDTEHPSSSPLNDEHRKGQFVCAGCALPLFKSDSKFDSGTGWPSFFRAIDSNIRTKVDTSLSEARTEYHCARCLGHQGHLFNDGPQPTGLRFCNNGVALSFQAS